MNGVIIIDKPSGKTSFAVVEHIKKILGARKVGHAGTLDPLATGVLPVCVNEATKLAQFFLMDSKEYRATMLLGVETDTLDIEGEITARKEPRVTKSGIENILSSFVGEIEQKPPRYSAVKFKGKPLYKWARRGSSVDPPPRMVDIHQIILENVELPYVTFFVSCSKGTYIRSLCSDIGKRLGCGACLSALRRIRSGNFVEEAAISFENIDTQKREEMLVKNLIPMVDTLSCFPTIDVDQKLAGRLRNGYQPVIGDMVADQIDTLTAGNVIKFVSGGNCLVALAKMLYSFDQISSLDSRKQVVEIIRVFKCC
jgi:tRNA pseudouridine55 synthase